MRTHDLRMILKAYVLVHYVPEYVRLKGGPLGPTYKIRWIVNFNSELCKICTQRIPRSSTHPTSTRDHSGCMLRIPSQFYIDATLSFRSHIRIVIELIQKKTGRILWTMLKEHRSLVRNHGPNSCLALHCVGTGHFFNWQDTRTLEPANLQRVRKVIESIHSSIAWIDSRNWTRVTVLSLRL